jgi:hypothetical protein
MAAAPQSSRQARSAMPSRVQRRTQGAGVDEGSRVRAEMVVTGSLRLRG